MCRFQRARVVSAAGLCVLLLGSGSRIQAQSEGWRLEWSAPRSCPSERDVEDRIRARLSANEAAPVRARVRVQRRGAAFHVRIRLSGAVNAERVLDAESCEAAADASALLITLAIQPDAVTTDAPNRPASVTVTGEDPAGGAASTSTREATDATTTSDEAVAKGAADNENEGDDDAESQDDVENEDEEDAAVTVDAADGAPLAVAWDAGLGVAFDWGTLPGPTGGGLLQVNLAIERVLLSVSAGGWLPRSTSIAADASVSVGWISATLDACYLRGDALQLGPCLGVELGRYSWNADGLVDTRDDHELAAFASASFTGRARLTNALYAALWVGVRTSLSYPELLVVGAGDVFSPAPLGLRAGLLLTLVLE